MPYFQKCFIGNVKKKKRENISSQLNFLIFPDVIRSPGSVSLMRRNGPLSLKLRASELKARCLFLSLRLRENNGRNALKAT